MHRIDTPTAQKDKFGAGKNGFTRGNPQTGVAATDLDDDYFDSIQEEIAGLVEAGGLTLDKADRGQVLKALKLLFAANTDSMGALAALVGAANKLPYFTGPKAAALADLTAFAREILAQTDAAGVLSKLGLGTAAKKDVGTSSDQIPDMSSFASAGVSNVFSSIVIAGNRRIMEGNGSGTFVNGILSFTLPLAYQNTGFTFIPTDIGSGVVSYAAIPASGSVVTIYGKTATGGNLSGEFAFKYMAMGSAS
ncbi:hypothetical protein LAX16_08755 [Escherichia coli]|nr:hypothetical protein [Escherichia coli]